MTTFNTPFIVRQCAGNVQTYGYWPAVVGALNWNVTVCPGSRSFVE